MSPTSDTSVDWPLRAAKKSHTIFLASMTDWMAKFYPVNWQSLLLGTMSLATWHTFITLTKRWDNLVSMLYQIHETANRTIAVPADTAFVKGILRANVNRGKYNLSDSLMIRADVEHAAVPPRLALTPFQERASVPWPPRNVIFGISICTAEEADRAMPLLYNMRKQWPGMKIAVSQEPALDVIDWQKVGLQKGIIDWLIWGGESGDGAREAHLGGWDHVREWGRSTRTPVFFKQTGSVIAEVFGLKSPKGDDFEEFLERFPSWEPVQETIDMQGSLV